MQKQEIWPCSVRIDRRPTWPGRPVTVNVHGSMIAGTFCAPFFPPTSATVRAIRVRIHTHRPGDTNGRRESHPIPNAFPFVRMGENINDFSGIRFALFQTMAARAAYQTHTHQHMVCLCARFLRPSIRLSARFVSLVFRSVRPFGAPVSHVYCFRMVRQRTQSL